MRLLPAIALMACFAAQPVFAADDCAPSKTRLDISAEASVKAAPDIANVSAGVVTVAKTADAAMKANAKDMTTMFAALKAAGVADKDMQTTGLTVNPQYVYEQNKSPVITGYQANNTVSVNLRDLKNMGPVLDALVAKGANQINGPNFSVEKPDGLLDKARGDAVAKARARAEIYAKAAGMKVSRIVNISENVNMGGPRPVMMMAARAKMADAMESSPVAAGEVDMSVTVNVTFEME